MKTHYTIVQDEEGVRLTEVEEGHPGSFPVHHEGEAEALTYEVQGNGHRSEHPEKGNPFRPLSGPNPWPILGDAIVLNQKLMAKLSEEDRAEFEAAQRRLMSYYFWS